MVQKKSTLIYHFYINFGGQHKEALKREAKVSNWATETTTTPTDP